jgi:hypothetical protein
MQIRLLKKTDRSAALTCVRPDGSVTWQRQDGRQGGFFPLHDLTHYAVETTLGYRRAFYGLLAQGWEITDFGTPWPRGPLPEEALHAEVLVGMLDAERGAGALWTAEEVNAQVASYYAAHGLAAPAPISQAGLDRIHDARRDLFARWAAVRPGAALELSFPPQAG